MRDSVSFWRRVAGLYLSAAPIGPDDSIDDDMSPDTLHSDASGLPDEGNRQQLFQLCEALDLVISGQGYNSPAVPPLLHALIGTVRLLRAAPGAAAEQVSGVKPEAAGDVPAPDVSAEPAPEPEPKMDEPEPEAPKAEAPATDGEAADQTAETEEAVPAQEALHRRVAATERKVGALTDAVGRLVEHLERRRWTVSPAERRGEARLPGIDAAVYIDRQRYRVIDWSQSGFAIQVGEGELLGRRRFAFRFTLELLDETIEFQGYATPMRREGTRLAARFVQLDSTVEAKLAEVVRRLAGGGI